MAFALFGRNRQKTNAELCRATKELLQKVAQEEKLSPKIEEELARNLAQMKLTLQGTTEIETSPQQVLQLVQYLMSEDLLYPLANNIRKLPFESRKDIQLIFSSVLRFKPPHTDKADPIVLKHIVNHRPGIVNALCHGYDYRASFLHCGVILREALKHECLTALVLYDEPSEIRRKGLQGIDENKPSSGRGVFWQFFEWIDRCDFDMSADCFEVFRLLVLKHKPLVIQFIRANLPLFVQRYNTAFLESSSYVTKRQSIKVLSEMLLERQYYILMTTYVEDADNLKLAMKLLRDERRMISYEAFHIFKVFVANPNKSMGVARILMANREKLLRFLPGFLEDRPDDVQLADEKAYCIRQIENLVAVSPMQQRGPGMLNAGAGAVTA